MWLEDKEEATFDEGDDLEGDGSCCRCCCCRCLCCCCCCFMILSAASAPTIMDWGLAFLEDPSPLLGDAFCCSGFLLLSCAGLSLGDKEFDLASPAAEGDFLGEADPDGELTVE